MDELKDKWYYIRKISALSDERGDRYGNKGLLKLLNETKKNNTQELTKEEAILFLREMENQGE